MASAVPNISRAASQHAPAPPPPAAGQRSTSKRNDEKSVPLLAFLGVKAELRKIKLLAGSLGTQLRKANERAQAQLERYRRTHVSMRVFKKVSARSATAKQQALEFARRLSKTRKIKLELEAILARKEEALKRAVDAKHAIMDEMLDQKGYIRENEREIFRQQQFIDKCMLNLKDGKKKLPAVWCSDCDQLLPLSDFQLRISTGKRVEHWMINPICGKCRAIRKKRVTHLSKTVPAQNGDAGAKELAGKIVGRMSPRIIDQVAARLNEAS